MGLMTLHGPHQVAQKSNTVYLSWPICAAPRGLHRRKKIARGVSVRRDAAQEADTHDLAELFDVGDGFDHGGWLLVCGYAGVRRGDERGRRSAGAGGEVVVHGQMGDL